MSSIFLFLFPIHIPTQSIPPSPPPRPPDPTAAGVVAQDGAGAPSPLGPGRAAPVPMAAATVALTVQAPPPTGPSAGCYPYLAQLKQGTNDLQLLLQYK